MASPPPPHIDSGAEATAKYGLKAYVAMAAQALADKAYTLQQRGASLKAAARAATESALAAAQLQSRRMQAAGAAASALMRKKAEEKA